MKQNIIVPLYNQPVDKKVLGTVTSCCPEIIIYPEEIVLLLCEDPQWSWHCPVVDVTAAFRVSEVLMRTPVDIITLNYNTIFWAFSGKDVDYIDKNHALRYLLEHIGSEAYTEIINIPIPEALCPI